MKIDLKKLTEDRQKALTDAKAIVEKAETENRDLNADEEKRYGDLLATAKSLEKRALRAQETADPTPATPAGGGTPAPEQRFSVPAIQAAGEHRRYSILRALRQMATAHRLDGYEAEVSQELAKRAGKAPQGFYMPTDFESPLEQRSLDSRYEQRTGVLNLTTGGSATGGVVAGLKPVITDVSNFIEILRNKALVRSLGARILSGLTGDLSIPKQTDKTTAYWFDSESGPISYASNPTVSQVGLAPKSLGVYTDISRKFLLQSAIDAESFLREDLGAVMALELDRCVINGSGSGAEPKGILQDTDIGTTVIGDDGGAPTWDTIVDLESQVAAANADVGSLAYLTNALVRGKLKRTPKIGTTYPVFLMDSDGQVNGYRCGVSNQVPSDLTKNGYESLSAMIYGNWESVLIGLWTGVDVLVDPYTGGTSGTVRIIMIQDADIKFRHAESFRKCVDIATT